MELSFTPEFARDLIKFAMGSPTEVLSDNLRGFIVASPGHELIGCDFAAIESRTLAWLAGADWKLEAYRAYDRGEGPDLYIVTYAKAFGVDYDSVDDDKRQVGKVLDLSMGFGGGVNAYNKMGAKYGVSASETEGLRLRDAYRASHPEYPRYWYALEEAAISAVSSPGKIFAVGPKGRQVAYCKDGWMLWCMLPSGRPIPYPYAKLKMVPTPWGKMKEAVVYKAMDEKNRWSEVAFYGGLGSENTTQATARDFLKEAIFRLVDAGYPPPPFHCHDEVFTEVPKGTGNVKEMEAICGVVPAWAPGIPIKAKGWCSPRYMK